MYKYEELRKLPTGSLYRISETLETNGDWRKVMSLIPKDPNAEKFEPKYNSQQMRIIEEHAKGTSKTCAEVLFDEWGTSGRIRPTLATLQNLILQAGIYKAADEIALMLQEAPPQRPNTGPAAKIETDIEKFLKEDTKIHGKKRNQETESTAQMISSGFPNFDNFSKPVKSIGDRTTASMKSKESVNYGSTREYSSRYSENTDMSACIPNFDILMKDKSETKSIVYPAPPLFRIDTTILENKTLIQFDYNELKEITSNFSNVFIYGPLGPTGKIGSGAFGDVYAGMHPEHGVLAVKRIKNLSLISDKPDLISQTFNAEVKCLAQLRHENIVPIVGYSIQKEVTSFPSLCIVCQYIEGRSLEQNLAAKRLTEKQRIDIIVGTARGLKYIHNRDSSMDDKVEDGVEDSFMHYIHGDVKSANILLTRDYQPKLCDFGLAKQFKTTLVSPSIMGTTPYMSPERLRGTVTQKADIYSFGIVILELLTGLQCLVSRNKEIINLQDYVAEKARVDYKDILDPVANPWSKANEIYELAKKCLTHDYTCRPNINEVCEEVANLIDDGDNADQQRIP
ncbi:unnamed protein product [Diatraea saccharalis]|uniref:Protein kinase domain-containing protein n=1 Tax=Diatraea saccharalis TaxID=40085 RepID=A0A9N9RB36_9NEOP|nr:unnamed protein product [Diatraea saccharalis]